jgi:hypothetical protein
VSAAPAARRRSGPRPLARLVVATLAVGALAWLGALAAVVAAASRDRARPAAAKLFR